MILDRYISASFLSSFFFALIMFTFLFCLTEAFLISKESGQQSPAYLYYYILLSLPHFINQVLPIALMFGSCFSISQLNLSSELVAIYSIGRSFYRAISFPLFFSLILALLQLGANQFFFREFTAKANRYKTILKKGNLKFSAKEIHAQNLRGKEGFYYINYFDRKDKNIYDGFTYLQLDGKDRPLHFYEAKDASYRPSQKLWLLTEVRVIHFDSDIRVSSMESKESLLLRLPEKPEFFEKTSHSINELGLGELYQEIQKRSAQGSDSLEYIIELHTRLSYPLTCLLLCFIGMLGGASGRRRSGSSFTQALLVSIIAVLIYYVSFTLCHSMAISGVLYPAFAPWLPVSIYSAAAFYLVRRV